MRQIEDALIVAARMNPGRETVCDADGVAQDAGNGSQAVRRAGTTRNDGVFCRVVRRIVDAQNEREVLTFGWSADDHAFGARLLMQSGFGAIGEETGAFEDDVDTEFFPGKL